MKLKEDKAGHVFVKGLKEVNFMLLNSDMFASNRTIFNKKNIFEKVLVRTADDGQALLTQGAANRQVIH